MSDTLAKLKATKIKKILCFPGGLTFEIERWSRRTFFKSPGAGYTKYTRITRDEAADMIRQYRNAVRKSGGLNYHRADL